MKLKNLLSILFIFIVPVVAYFILSKSDANAISKTDSANKPKIIKFTSLMCYDCKKLEKEMKVVYPKYSKKINLVEIHVQENDDYTKKQIEKYNIQLVPTLILLNSRGKQIAKTEGYVEKSQLDKMMKDLSNE